MSARQTGSHEIFRHEKENFVVVVPKHKEIKKGTIQAIIDDLGMTVEEFFDLL